MEESDETQSLTQNESEALWSALLAPLRASQLLQCGFGQSPSLQEESLLESSWQIYLGMNTFQFQDFITVKWKSGI